MAPLLLRLAEFATDFATLGMWYAYYIRHQVLEGIEKAGIEPASSALDTAADFSSNDF